ncbi:hypothetical protein Anapl_08993 [Anas platyrhynchos]|uniref:Uncharacterized protein n=1 Tax=Anas platyrhynchos TaxID=8839 RepID=R0K023_ANAPL|nr:hypothetical protein Anapl_08993 [Anas platyrhynchos]
MSQRLVGGRAAFSAGVPRRPTGIPWMGTEPAAKRRGRFVSVLSDFPPEVSLSPTLVLTGLWDSLRKAWEVFKTAFIKIAEALKAIPRADASGVYKKQPLKATPSGTARADSWPATREPGTSPKRASVLVRRHGFWREFPDILNQRHGQEMGNECGRLERLSRTGTNKEVSTEWEAGRRQNLLTLGKSHTATQEQQPVLSFCLLEGGKRAAQANNMQGPENNRLKLSEYDRQRDCQRKHQHPLLHEPTCDLQKHLHGLKRLNPASRGAYSPQSDSGISQCTQTSSWVLLGGFTSSAELIKSSCMEQLLISDTCPRRPLAKLFQFLKALVLPRALGEVMIAYLDRKETNKEAPANYSDETASFFSRSLKQKGKALEQDRADSHAAQALCVSAYGGQTAAEAGALGAQDFLQEAAGQHSPGTQGTCVAPVLVTRDKPIHLTREPSGDTAPRTCGKTAQEANGRSRNGGQISLPSPLSSKHLHSWGYTWCRTRELSARGARVPNSFGLPQSSPTAGPGSSWKLVQAGPLGTKQGKERAGSTIPWQPVLPTALLSSALKVIDRCPGICQCTLQRHVDAQPGDAVAAQSSRGLCWTSVGKRMAFSYPLPCEACSDSFVSTTQTTSN